MTLSEQARTRLADVVELQPTKNAALQDKWGLDSGSEVHSYLESELEEHYYRNEDSLICATPGAEALIGDGEIGSVRSIPGTALQRAIVAVLPGPDEEPQSVVATLHGLEEQGRENEPESPIATLSKDGTTARERSTDGDGGESTAGTATVPSEMSAVAHAGDDVSVDNVRSALHTLVDKGVVERVSKTVPTYRLALGRDHVEITT